MFQKGGSFDPYDPPLDPPLDGSNDITIATGNTSSTLTVTTVTMDDSGNYTCTVSNFLGTATDSSLLHIQGVWMCYIS